MMASRQSATLIAISGACRRKVASCSYNLRGIGSNADGHSPIGYDVDDAHFNVINFGIARPIRQARAVQGRGQWS